MKNLRSYIHRRPAGYLKIKTVDKIFKATILKICYSNLSKSINCFSMNVYHSSAALSSVPCQYFPSIVDCLCLCVRFIVDSLSVTCPVVYWSKFFSIANRRSELSKSNQKPFRFRHFRTTIAISTTNGESYTVQRDDQLAQPKSRTFSHLSPTFYDGSFTLALEVMHGPETHGLHAGITAHSSAASHDSRAHSRALVQSRARLTRSTCAGIVRACAKVEVQWFGCVCRTDCCFSGNVPADHHIVLLNNMLCTLQAEERASCQSSEGLYVVRNHLSGAIVLKHELRKYWLRELLLAMWGGLRMSHLPFNFAWLLVWLQANTLL